jgi:hypothetical protein
MCLWAEAVIVVAYVRNQLSHSALGFQTPEEMPSGKKGIFVGYCEVSKAFKIYIPGHRHIEISRDVTFDEEAALKKSRRC